MSEPSPVITSISSRLTSAIFLPARASRRGSLSLDAGASPFVDASTTLGGGPGDTVMIDFGSTDGAASCVLVDRADVAVQLLTS